MVAVGDGSMVVTCVGEIVLRARHDLGRESLGFKLWAGS